MKFPVLHFLPNALAANRDQPVTSAFLERATFTRIRSDALSLHGMGAQSQVKNMMVLRRYRLLRWGRQHEIRPSNVPQCPTYSIVIGRVAHAKELVRR